MLTKVIKYKDFSGQDREGTIYFNLTRSELIRWLITDEGLIQRLETIQSRSGREIIDEFDGIIKKSFGVRSEDGKRFIKNDEVYNDFVQTALYDEFFMQIVTDPDEARVFMNKLLPQELIQQAQQELKKQQDAGIVPSYAQEQTNVSPNPSATAASWTGAPQNSDSKLQPGENYGSAGASGI